MSTPPGVDDSPAHALPELVAWAESLRFSDPTDQATAARFAGLLRRVSAVLAADQDRRRTDLADDAALLDQVGHVVDQLTTQLDAAITRLDTRETQIRAAMDLAARAHRAELDARARAALVGADRDELIDAIQALREEVASARTTWHSWTLTARLDRLVAEHPDSSPSVDPGAGDPVDLNALPAAYRDRLIEASVAWLRAHGDTEKGGAHRLTCRNARPLVHRGLAVSTPAC